MSGSSFHAKALNAAMLLSGFLGQASAARRLHQAAECGVLLPATDLNKGVGNIAGGGPAATQEDCVTLCEAAAGCNAAIYVSNGNCFLKNVNTNTVSLDPDPTITSFILCDVPFSDDVTLQPLPSGSTPIAEFTCGEFAPGIDIPGVNIGSGATASNEDCLQLCTDTAGCNAAIRADVSGGCFLKTVDTAALEPVAALGLTTYVTCDGGASAPGAGAVPAADAAPVPAPDAAPVPAPDAAPVPAPDPATVPAPAPAPGVAPAPAPEDDVAVGIASVGQWGDIIEFPLIPVAAAALPNGEVLVWAGDSVDHFAPSQGTPGTTFYAVFDSNTNTVGALQSVALGHDMFCPGISILPNSEVIVVGGSAGGDGHAASSVFANGAWASGPQLSIPRGYNAAVTLSTGEVMTLGGSFSGGISIDKGAEIFDGNAWRTLPNLKGETILSDDPQGAFRTDNYAHLFAWTGNSVFHAGPSKGMNWLTGLEGQGVNTTAGARSQTAMNGNAVMYAAGKILLVGGAPSFSLGDQARSGAEIITLGDITVAPDLEEVAGPNIARTYAMAVVLPNGEVVHFGGATTAVEFSDASAVLDTEIWNPDTKAWTVDAAASIPRTYHSSAVLVPDGRVFVGGGGLCGGCSVNHLDAQMFSPRYLFNEDGTSAVRPNITMSSDTVAPGGAVTVTGTEDLAMVAMVRMSSSTHSSNTDQRRLELCGASSTPCGGAVGAADVLQVNVPGQGVAIPGPWMVFGFNAAGVPSKAEILTVTTTP